MKNEKKTTKQAKQNQEFCPCGCGGQLQRKPESTCDHQVARTVHEPKILVNRVEVCACGAFRIISQKGEASRWYEVPEGREYRLKSTGYMRDEEGVVLYREAYALALSLQEGQEKVAYENYTEDELVFHLARRNGKVTIGCGSGRPSIGWL